MEKFYYFLKDNPHYPGEIMARNKNEVVSLLKDDMGEHAVDFILNILTEEEFTGKPSNPAKNSLYENINNNDNDIITNTLNTLSQVNMEQPQAEVQPQQNLNNITILPNVETKYFSAGGEQFKLENGKLFKKIWKTVQNPDEYRIIKSDTLKPIKSDKYKIEILDWSEVE